MNVFLLGETIRWWSSEYSANTYAFYYIYYTGDLGQVADA